MRALALAALVLGACAPTSQDEPLPRLRIEPGSLTVSGLSSGGYMATQYQVAFSRAVKGAGIVAAGPWLCAQGILTRALRDCLAGEAAGPDVAPLVAALRASAALGVVDDPAGLAEDRIWIFHGAKDETVGAAVSDALVRFYKPFVPIERIRYVTQVPAAHGFPTMSAGGACAAGKAPWILACGYDAAGEMLAFLYGGLDAPSGNVTGTLRSFGQARYVQRGLASMADTGFLFVPRDCAAGQPCRLHVAFHGCGQGIDRLGRTFARQAGYERWADANRIVVLFPQAAESKLRPLNPRGCWDWWGYSGADYAARSGAQLSAVRRMVEALGGR
jgi:poly(3-hydroxybutyrate) depolymerase